MTSTDLRGVVASLLQLAPEAVSSATSLQKFSGSLERTKLEFGLRRIGLQLPPGPVGLRFADLESRLGLNGGTPAAIAPTASSPPDAVAPGVSGDRGGLNIGVDIEAVTALPEAPDPWEHEFYRGTFTPSEIAACLMQQDPRVHFAGTWCVKEALRKSSPEYAGLEWQSMQVDHEPDGAPFVQVLQGNAWERLPCAVSVSHTADIAAAVVAWRRLDPVLSVAPVPAGGKAFSNGRTTESNSTALLLSAIAVAASVIAILIAI